MKHHSALLLLIFIIGLIQKVNSQTESSWLENYEITQLASPEKDILVLSIKNSGKSKKDCLRKAKEQALFHLLFKGISSNEISAGNNISPRKPIPFLEKFDQNDEKNGLNRFIRKTGFENIVDAEKDENIDGVKNEDKSKTFVSVIKLNTRSLVTQLEDLNLKRTFIEELGFKPKILFLPSNVENIQSYITSVETNPFVTDYNNQYNLINASLGKLFDVINLFSLKEKLASELAINQEKTTEFKEREIDIIARVFVSDVIMLLKQSPDKQSGLQAILNPVLLSFTPVGKPILISDKETTKKTDLELIQIILSTETDLIIEDIFFNLIDQKGKTQNIKVELSCNKRIKKVIDEKIAHAENNLSFLEIIQDYFNSKGIKLIPDGKSNNQFYVTIENFKSPFIAQQEKFVDEITNLVAQKTGFTLDIDFTGNSLVRLELTEIKRLERQRKINSDYQRAISQKSLELHLQFLKEFPDAEYFSEMKGRYNDLISDKVKNRLSEEEYKLFLNDEFCTASRNAVLVSYIEAQIPANWASFSSMNDLKKVIQSVNQISQDYNYDYSYTQKYLSLSNLYNEMINEKLKTKLSREEYSALLKDEYCTTSRSDVETSLIKSLIPANWKEITTIKGINELVKNINSACKQNNLTTSLMTNYCYSTSDFFDAGEWTFENLNVSHFINGDTIYEAKTNEEWIRANNEKQPAWCYYNNDESNQWWYVKLYNYYALSDPRGLVQEGYVIPSVEDYQNLIIRLGGKYSAGRKMKAIELWGEERKDNDNQHYGNDLKLSNTEFGLTVLNQDVKNDSKIILNNGYNNWEFLENGAIVLKDNHKFGLTVRNQLISDYSEIILHEGYNLWQMNGDGSIVLKNNPNFGLTVLDQNIGNNSKIILHQGFNKWDYHMSFAFTAKVTGYRNEKGAFIGGYPSNIENGEISYTGFWTSTQNGGNATAVYLQQNSDEAKILTNCDKGNGWAVRVMKKKSENEPILVTLPVITEIQLKRDQFLLKEFQSKKEEEGILNLFCNQLKEEISNPGLNNNEVDYLNYNKMYHRIWDNPKLVKNGYYPYYRAYKPYPDIFGMAGEYGEGPILSKIGYTNNIENYHEFDDGTIYKGSIANGMFSGEGTLIAGEYYLWELQKGDKYQGTFKDGKFLKGKISYVNGNIYEGECHYYQPNGQGKLTLSNGQVQQGKFVNGEFIKPFTCKEVKIGNQIWMAENLNVSKFRNGDPILEAKSNEEWVEAGFKEKPAWCYYNNDPTNESRYGKLYNYYAVIDPRGLAPDGWRIPTEFDFNTLDNYLTENTAGKKMKNTSGWSNNGNGTNESGFSALPGGYRQAQNGFFFNLYESGGWWSITDLGFNTLSSGYHGLGGNRDDGFSYVGVWLGEGVSVRCIKN
jgi:uncharacterized protein (TIGR02145 family)